MTKKQETIEVEDSPSATPEQLAHVLATARRQAKLAAEIAKAEDALKKQKNEYKKTAEIELPNALRAAQLNEMPLGEGWSVRLKTTLAGYISEERKETAHAWLEEHDMGGLIKHVITITFGRDEDSFFKKFMADLAKRKKPVQAERKDAVNTATLGAFVREQVGKAQEQGLDPREVIPFDLLGVYQTTYAEIVPPKKPKAASL